MKIIIDNGDGTVTISTPVLDCGLTAAQIIDKDIRPRGKSFVVVFADEVPSDRTYRGAWKAANGGVEVDMPRARVIHMGRIRVKRDKELKRLDIETMKGLDVQAEKQILRDLPETFDLSVATTPEELTALIPPELEGV